MSLGIWSWILASLFICISAAPSDVSKSAGLPRGVLRGSSENACAKFPCRHGGRCQAAGAGLYTCTCPWKFVGDHCETLYQPCHPNPCRNRGACNRDATETTYMCTCMHGFKGRDCEIRDNPCNTDPCQHGGTCNWGYGDRPYVCTCNYGWKGQDCEYPNVPCLPEPCMNGGTCYSLVNYLANVYQCVCPPGYGGKRCDVSTYSQTLALTRDDVTRDVQTFATSYVGDKDSSLPTQDSPLFGGGLVLSAPAELGIRPEKKRSGREDLPAHSKFNPYKPASDTHFRHKVDPLVYYRRYSRNPSIIF